MRTPLLAALAFVLAAPACAEFTAAALRESGYFERLDYDDAAVAAGIPEFDARLRASADAALKAPALEPGAALALVYTSLYIANADYGARAGKVALDAAALPAREELAIKYLEAARGTLSGDKRIPGWLAGARIRAEAFRDGKPSAAAVEQMLEAAESYPMFNLFSGLILSNEHSLGPQTDERLFKLVELMTGKSSPCKAEDAHCGGSELAPFADPGAMVLLGDAFMRHGAKRGRESHEFKHETGMALILYTVQYFKGASSFKRWPRRGLLGQRIEVGRHFRNDAVPLTEEMYTGAQARQAYQCASCHSRGKAPPDDHPGDAVSKAPDSEERFSKARQRVDALSEGR